jgi:uracil-DNA glycosylase
LSARRPRRPLAPAERRALGYFADLGFDSVRIPDALPPVPDAAEAAVFSGPGGSTDAPAARPVVLDPGERLRLLEACRDEALACTACRLAGTRQKVVFGSGDPRARLLFIGEGPGAEEDKQGLPFVGRAGELLTKIIEAIGLTREQVYIANVVKCRPPGNRDPEPDEVVACRSFLERQIDLVGPQLLVILGRIAAQTLLGTDTQISKMRGNWYPIRGLPAMVTFHPAALLRNPALKRPVWDDMQKVRDRLAELDVERAGG